MENLSPEMLREVMHDVLSEMMAPAAELEKLRRQITVTPIQASKLLGIPVGTLHNWRSQGRGPAYSKDVGSNKVVYLVRELEKWVEQTGKKVNG